ncbi:MAG: zinc metallopeptidase [Chitinophagales bacterium]
MIFGLIGMLVSGRLKSKFKKYSMMPLSSWLNRSRMTLKMLRDSGITDVTIQSVQG